MNLLTILFPKARGAILRLLFGQPGREYHLRDLSRQAELTAAAVQKELAGLAAAGVVSSRRDGNRLYFRANTAHPVYPELHGIVVKTAGFSAELSRALEGVDGVEAAFIFGSMAAGTAAADSDLDVLILGTSGLRKVSSALRGLAGDLGREINPVCLTREEWHRRLAAGDAFLLRLRDEPKIWLKGGPDVPR